MVKLRVLLADDHAVVRDGLKALIDAQPDLEVVGEASDGESACQKASDLLPDVVVMDVSMPGMSGAGATERLKRDHPGIQVLALTVYEDKGHLRSLLQAEGTLTFLDRLHRQLRGAVPGDQLREESVRLWWLRRRRPRAPTTGP